jgi:hypothetical protein
MELCLCFNLKKKNMLNKFLNIWVKYFSFLGKIFRLNTIKIFVVFVVGFFLGGYLILYYHIDIYGVTLYPKI